MLLDLEKLIKEFNLEITGVIHVGMHHMEELKLYKKCGIHYRIWIEANEELCEMYQKKTKETIICEVISDKQEMVDFYLTSRTASNSILEPYMNMKYRKDISITDKQRRYAVPLSTYDFGVQYNMLNLDIQGAELKALKGANLKNIEYIYTEVNIKEMYKDVPRIDELDEYLKDYKRVATHIHKKKFGDALYIRHGNKR